MTHNDPVATARPARALLAAVVAAGALSGCGGGSDSVCGPTVVEQIDPSQGHLIAGATEPRYLTDPPTSGPHVAGLVLTGRRDRPMSGIEQVSTLEAGVVIVQYRPADVDRRGRRQLEGLASGTVTVAPNPTLPSAVVATGWLRKMQCSGVDPEATRRFIDDVAGRYQGHGGTSTSVAVPGSAG